MTDPKDSKRSVIDPKDSGRDDTDPKDSRRGGGGGEGDGPVGVGGGWVVVAFISPVGMSVPDLAARMLSGSGPQGRLTGLQRTPLMDAAVLAKDKARERIRIHEEERTLLDQLRSQKTGGRPDTT